MANKRVDVLAVMDAAGAALDLVYSEDDLRKDLISARAAVAELRDATSSYLYFVDSYGEDAECTKAALLRLRVALARLGGEA